VTLTYSVVGTPGYQSLTLFTTPPLPPALLPQSRVGVFTTWPGTSDFTELVFSSAAGGASQDFLQPPALPILGRLQVKREFLHPAMANGGTSMPGNPVVSPLSDFSMWFWLLPSMSGYGYGYGRSGAGGVGLNQV
jgi:hypothetical protein